MKKRIVSAIIAVSMLCTMFAVVGVKASASTADQNLWTDYAVEITPNEDGVYEIYTAEQLAWVAKVTNETPMVNEAPWSIRKEFRLMNSIDISAHQWVPIGTVKGVFGRKDNKFAGWFDGNGKTIKGLTIHGEFKNGGTQNVGLFGSTISFTKINPDTGLRVYQNYIKDLYLTDVSIDVIADVKDLFYVGSIVGEGGVNLYNCSASGTIKTRNVLTTGGITGKQTAPMTKCVSNVTITAGFDTMSKFSYVGGVAGDLVEGFMTACSSKGDINVNNIVNCGGLAGNVFDVIQASYSVSKINATPGTVTNIGSIVGAILKNNVACGEIISCFMATDINGGIGGVGASDGDPSVQITEKTLGDMKTPSFKDELVAAGKGLSYSEYLAEIFMSSFQDDILEYYMVHGLPSSVHQTEFSTQLTATANIPSPTYTIIIPSTIDFENQTQALSKYENQAQDQYGNPVVVSKPLVVKAENVDNLFDDLGFEPNITVSATFDGVLKGTKDTTATIPYAFKIGTTSMASGQVFGSFKNASDLTNGETNTVMGTIEINRTKIHKSDSYEGTMTFTINIPKS